MPVKRKYNFKIIDFLLEISNEKVFIMVYYLMKGILLIKELILNNLILI